MVIISVGMPKSGSTLFSWYQKDIVKRYFPENGQAEFESLVAGGTITGKGHFVGEVTNSVLELLLNLARTRGPLVVKTKDSPVNGTSAPVFRLMSDS